MCHDTAVQRIVWLFPYVVSRSTVLFLVVNVLIIVCTRHTSYQIVSNSVYYSISFFRIIIFDECVRLI